MKVPEHLVLTGRIESYLKNPQGRLPVSCTVFVVANKMYGRDGIIDSWEYTSYGLRHAAGVAVHLSEVQISSLQAAENLKWYVYIDPDHPNAGRIARDAYNQVETIPADAKYILRIADSMEEETAGQVPIQKSWGEFVAMAYSATAENEPVYIDLSALRPAMVKNDLGLVASGPASFYVIYQAVANFIKNPTMVGLMSVYSRINEILRRGGTYKNGAVNLHLDADHPDVLDFALASRQDTAWARLTLNVDESFIDHQNLEQILPRVASGDLFLVKKLEQDGRRVYHNVCVHENTVTMTSTGPQLVSKLNEPFNIIVGDKEYPCNPFVLTNKNAVCYSVRTEAGFSFIATGEHQVFTVDQYDNTELVAVKNLSGCPNQIIIALNESGLKWGGPGSYKDGWFLGANTQGFYKVAVIYPKEEQEFCLKTRYCNLADLKPSVPTPKTTRIRNNKTQTELCSYAFYLGFLGGVFDTYLHVNREAQTLALGRGLYYDTQQLIQKMLARVGIYSFIADNYLHIAHEKDVKLALELIGLRNEVRKEQVYKDLPKLRYAHADTRALTYEASVQELALKVPVYDAKVESDEHAYEADCIKVHNCLEINIESRATCLLAHINAGSCIPKDLPKVYAASMKWLCEFHGMTGVGRDGQYLPPELDKQVGLGVIGLANMLAIEEISYKMFGKYLRIYAQQYGKLGDLPPYTQDSTEQERAENLAYYFVKAFEGAAEVARSYGMQRAFTIAPTATTSFKAVDRLGYTTAPEISPPLDRQVTRLSETMEEIDVDYHPDCEIASEVGWDTYFELMDAWQLLMDATGLGHTISSNWWSDVVAMDKAFIRRWLDSHWKSLYYAMPVRVGTQDKSEVISCGLDKAECTSCAE